MSDDSDLRDRFAVLRAADGRRAPAFGMVLQRAVRRSPRRATARRPAKVALALSVAVALLVVALARMHPAREAPQSRAGQPGQPARPVQPAGPKLADWRAPTDFLLDTPGSELLRTLPRFGTAAPDWLRGDSPHPSRGRSAPEEPRS